MREGAAFCANCGTAAQGSRPPAATVPPPGAQPPQPRSGNPLMKALLIVLAVIVALGAMGIIGSIYVIHRVKRTVVSAARERGVELRDFAASPYRGRMPDPCSLLTTREASSILGVTIERAESHGRRCDYFAHPVSGAEREAEVKKALEDVRDRAKENDDDANKAARESGAEELTKKIIAGANAGAGPYFTIELNENGKAAIAAMKLATGVISGAVKTTESLTGIGDEAIMGPMDSMLLFTKDGLGVQIDLRQIGKGRDRAIAMARQMEGRL